MKKSTKRIIFLTVLFVLILLFAVILISNAISNYYSFKSHQNEIHSPNPKIEDWMSPGTILRHFNISPKYLFDTLNIPDSRTNLRKPLSQICAEQKINCTQLVDKLNNLAK